VKTANILVGLYAVAGSIAFLVIQTGKLFRYETADKEMISGPLGLLDWGFVWADTLLPMPFLLIGGIFLFTRSRILYRTGRFLVFSGFAINLYAMIVLWIGLWKIGHPMSAGLFWMNVVLTFFGALGMIFLISLTDHSKKV
jgi:hypothetical protein